MGISQGDYNYLFYLLCRSPPLIENFTFFQHSTVGQIFGYSHIVCGKVDWVITRSHGPRNPHLSPCCDFCFQFSMWKVRMRRWTDFFSLINFPSVLDVFLLIKGLRYEYRPEKCNACGIYPPRTDRGRRVLWSPTITRKHAG